MKEDKTKRAKFSSPFVSLLEGLGEGLVFILLFLFFLLPFSASAQTDTIRYVNAQTGKYANDGKSWDKAKDNVQDAINDLYDYMQRNNLHSGSVYVAAGKYYPSESTGSGSSVLSTSFKIYDGIHLYGGFNPKNPEATPDQRKLSSAPQWKADDPKAKNKPTGSETDRPIGMAANDTIMSYDFKYATILSGNHSTVMGKFDWNNNKSSMIPASQATPTMCCGSLPTVSVRTTPARRRSLPTPLYTVPASTAASSRTATPQDVQRLNAT